MPGAILAYHLVDSRFDFGVTRITPRQFQRQMKLLSVNGCRGVPIREYVRAECKGADPKKCIGLTFDDGYASFMQYAAPVMDKHGFRGSIFIVKNFIGKENRWDVNLFWRRFRHLSWTEIRSLSQQGWEIGSHSCSHAYLPHLNDAQLWREVSESKIEIEQHIGSPVESFCLPFGRGDERVFRAIAKAGYRTVLTLGQVDEQHDRIRILKRQGVYRFDTGAAFKRKLFAPYDDAWQNVRQRFISSFSLGSIVVKKLFPTKQT